MKTRFELFAQEQIARLLRTAYLLTGDQQDAEDLVQDTMVKVLTRWKQVSDTRNAQAYATRMLVNHFLSGKRRRSARNIDLAAERAGSVPDFADGLADGHALARTLKSLPERERTAVVLKYYLRLDNHEVALAMGTADSTARSTLSRGLQALRQLLHDSSQTSQGGIDNEHIRD